MRGVASVSYTHLDVYKRQGEHDVCLSNVDALYHIGEKRRRLLPGKNISEKVKGLIVVCKVSNVGIRIDITPYSSVFVVSYSVQAIHLSGSSFCV